MTVKRAGIVCISLSLVLALAGGAAAQTSTPDLGDLLSSLTPDQLSQLTDAISGGGLGGLGGLTGTGAAASQPSTADRVGPPRTMVGAAIAEHLQFNGSVIANLTGPASQPTRPATVKIPIIYLFRALVDIGAQFIPQLQALADLLAGITPPIDGGNGNVTPPTPVTEKGIVAYLTADDTSLTVGQTTTGRLWVQQTSAADADNGPFSVGVNVETSSAGIVQAQVPVTIVAPWDQSPVGTLEGTATASGGITGIAGGLSFSADKSTGTAEPVEVANFTIRAVAAGTVELIPTNFVGEGFTGVVPWVGSSGDEENYVPVEITVTR